ncbi:unnamed protein product [Boreogadus saida]
MAYDTHVLEEYHPFKGCAVGGLLGYWAGASGNQPLSEALMRRSPSKQMELFVVILRSRGHWTDVAQVAEVLVNYGSKGLKGKDVCRCVMRNITTFREMFDLKTGMGWWRPDCGRQDER